jgi:hypothetical protein
MRRRTLIHEPLEASDYEGSYSLRNDIDDQIDAEEVQISKHGRKHKTHRPRHVRNDSRKLRTMMEETQPATKAENLISAMRHDRTVTGILPPSFQIKNRIRGIELVRKAEGVQLCIRTITDTAKLFFITSDPLRLETFARDTWANIN